MGKLIRSKFSQTSGALAALLLLVAPGLAAQTGSIAGRVFDDQSGQPIPAVQVFIPDLDLGVLSQQNGSYLLLNVPAGTHTVTVQRIGYGQTSQDVSVAAGETAVLDFRISEEALQLDEVIVTGTPGGSLRRALGNTVATIDAAEITQQANISTVQELMAGRTAGVRFGLTPGQVGGGSPITVRGVTSTTLGSQPLIYVDGVRLDNDATLGPETGIGSGAASALGDLNPDDIQSIEIIKGPSAASLYGTEASAGVIQIITKRGSVGAPEFQFEVTQGTNYMRDPQGTLGTQYACAIDAFQCPEDQLVEVFLYNEANDYLRSQGRYAGLDPSNPAFDVSPEYAPLSRDKDLFQNGHQQGYNLSVRGGTEQVRYYVSGSLLDETGVVDYQTNQQASMRANMTVLFSENVNVDVSTGYTRGKTQFSTVQGEGGAWHQMVWGRPYNLPRLRADNPATAFDESLGDGFLGFQERFPTVYESTDIAREYSRFIGSISATHNSGDWFTQKLTAGMDRRADTNNEYIPPFGSFPDFPGGYIAYGRPVEENFTVDYSANIRYRLNDGFLTTTSVGAQYYTRFSESVENEGLGFATPIQKVIDQTEFGNRQVNFTSSENKSLGLYVQEELAWQNRLFLTGAVRLDDNSAFGSDFDVQYYPRASASWVVSEEPFWNVDFVSSLRLRGSWGQSGRQPDTFAAQTLYTTFLGPNGNGLIPFTAGNPKVGPEVSTELDVGFDIALLEDRIAGEFSYFTTKTTDMLVNQDLAPSTGLTGDRDANLGEMKAWGWEATVDAQVWESDNIAFDLTLSADYTMNEITSLGEDVLPSGNLQIGWPFPNIASDYIIRSAELNAAGTNVDLSTVMCDGGRPAVEGGPNIMQGGETIPCSQFQEESLLLGPSFPKYNFSVAPTLTLYNNLQIFAVAQGQYGRWIGSTDAQYACGIYASCKVAVLRNDPVWLAGRLFGQYSDDRYQGRFPADYWTMRQVGLRYTLPESLVGRIGANRASLSISANNLFRIWQKTRTDKAGNPIYSPEYTVQGNDPGQLALWELPPLSTISATLRVTF